MTGYWDPDFAMRSPMFEPLRGAARALLTVHWPDCDDLNRMLDARADGIHTAGGHPLRFVPQALRQATFEDGYEPRIFLRGEVQIRPRNWHDVLNALVWMTFPGAKAALNFRQYRELRRRAAAGASNRGPAGDVLTLLDEGGVIVCCADAGLAALLSGASWKDLFWRQRAAAAQHMRFYLFGHALYEKALRPFPGVTGRAVMFDAEQAFLDLPLDSQLAQLDARLAARLLDTGRFMATRELPPLPILGVPDWCSDNASEAYYDNAEYFRPPRQRS